MGADGSPSNSGLTGHLVRRAVVGDGVIAGLRTDLGRMAFGGGGYLLPQDFVMVPAMESVVLAPSVLASVRSYVGVGQELVLFPNMTVRRNPRIGWHRDEASKCRFPPSTHVNCAVYLQSVGGLDVVSDNCLTARLSLPPWMLGAVFGAPCGASAGDIVVWEPSMIHRSGRAPKVDDQPRYGVYFTYALVSEDNRRFLDHLRNRAANDWEFLQPRYRSTVALEAGDVPQAFMAAAEEAGVRMLFCGGTNAHTS